MNIVTIKDFTEDATQSEINLSRMTTLLNRVKEGVSVPAVIAGGAVRDTLLGYPYNDIDFFLTGVPDDVLSLDDYAVLASEAVKDFSESVGWQNTHAALVGDYVEYVDSAFEVRRLYDAGSKAGPTFNKNLDFIARHASLEDTINSFDYGLVKGYYDGENFYVHDEFLEIMKNGRVNPQNKRAERRVKRWRMRTGYSLVIGRPPKVENTLSRDAAYCTTGFSGMPAKLVGAIEN
jgi:hypothetical protein